MRIIFIIGLFARIAAAQWTQDRFAIGSWWDPELVNNTRTDSTTLRRFVNGNFNLLLGQGDRYSYQFNATNGARNITNQYLLGRVAAVNGALGSTKLRAIVSEDAFRLSPTNIANYTGLTGTRASALYGYSVIHEPTHHPVAGQGLSLDTLLNRVRDIRNADPTRITGDVLASIWRVWNGSQTFQQNWTSFENYVRAYVNHASTRVAAFDYYVLSEWNGVMRYSPMGADRVNYYATMGLFAQSTTSAGKTFWNYASANDRQIDWWTGTVHVGTEHFPYPTNENLRFNAYSSLVYGAKGIVWYTYDIPTTTCNPAVTTCETFTWTASNDNTIYTRVKSVNAEMVKLGPTLMRLNWINTVHGSATDPYSGETLLPTINASTPVLANEDTHDEIAIGIFQHKDNSRNYLAFFNKDWTSTKNLWFTLKGFSDAFLFNKTNSTWTRIPSNINWSGTKSIIGINFNAADLQLVDVRADIINPLHQYWNTGATSHYYTSTYQGLNNCCGWAYEQTIGGVYKSQLSGTVPLYVYYNAASTDWYYTTVWQGQNNCCGWAYQNIIAGYVYSSQQPGTVPLYEYWNASLTDHFYTTQWQGNDNGNGWIYQNNIVGYIVPNV